MAIGPPARHQRFSIWGVGKPGNPVSMSKSKRTEVSYRRAGQLLWLLIRDCRSYDTSQTDQTAETTSENRRNSGVCVQDCAFVAYRSHTVCLNHGEFRRHLSWPLASGLAPLGQRLFGGRSQTSNTPGSRSAIRYLPIAKYDCTQTARIDKVPGRAVSLLTPRMQRKRP